MTSAQISTVQRAQFAPTTKKHQEWYSDQQKTLDYLFKAELSIQNYAFINDFLSPKDKAEAAKAAAPLDEVVIDKNGYELTNRELATMVNSKKIELMRQTGLPGLSNECVKMICQYVNVVRNQGAAMKGPSCVMLSSEQYEGVRIHRGKSLENYCVRTMKNLGYNSLHAFMELDFLFIPYVYYEHTSLFGIAPKQRFVFLIDSIPNKYDSKSNLALGLMGLLFTLIPDYAFAEDGTKATPDEWTVFGQWSQRTQTTDGSPDAAQQCDSYNCGIFACTTAFCLAFGFDLNCFTQADLNPHKKPRMVAEFVNGGFFGPGFDYDLLNFPQYRTKEPALAPTAKQPGASNLQKSATSPPVSNQQGGPAPPRKGALSTRIKNFLDRKRRQGDDDEEQRGLEDDNEEEGSDGESDDEEDLGFMKEPLYTRRQLNYTLNLLPDTSAKKRDNTVPFPPQFESKTHKQATLIYGGVPAGFNFQNRKYSKRELKQACRDFQVEGWKPWSRERQGFFMKYVMNEIQGIMARRRGDAVKPLEGVGEVPILNVETAPIKTQAGRSSKRRKTTEVVEEVVIATSRNSRKSKRQYRVSIVL